MSRLALLGGVALLVAAGAASLGLRWRPAGEPPTQGPPRRIASLTLASDEVLAQLAPDRVVAVTYLVDDPDISSAAGVYPASVPRLREKDVERLLALRPDLVCVASYNDADFLEVVRRAGVLTHRNESFGTITDIEANIRSLGERVGAAGRAEQLIADMRRRLAAVAARVNGVTDRPRVLYWSGGRTAGEGTTIDEMIRRAGGRNAVAEANVWGSAALSPERVLAIDPDVVLLSRWKAYDADNRIDNQPALRGLRAVRQGRVIAIDARCLTTLSHAIVEGAERLAQALHPERFEEKGKP
jgi:iron complex transport system substrate-binding protein